MVGTLTADDARRELYRIMSDQQPFEQKAQQALALGREYLGVENGHLTRIDTDSDYWKAIVSTDSETGRFPPGLILDLGTTYCRKAITEDPVRLHNAPQQGWADDPAYAAHDLDTYHGTALMVDDEPYGTVCFVSEAARDDAFSDEETMFAELISRMLEAEIRHERAQRKLDRLDQFASVVSHDLRNPLSIAQGNVDLARETDDDLAELATASRALDRMEDLIDDVLSLARQSKDVTETESIQLSTLVEACWTAVDTATADLQVDGDCVIVADRRRVKQLFENLFRNSIEHGGPEITIRVGTLSEQGGFFVEDSGPGIPAEDRESVFETGFSTGDDGLGLGLAIVSGVVSAHEWEIAVTEGSLGGARFEISNVITESTSQ